MARQSNLAWQVSTTALAVLLAAGVALARGNDKPKNQAKENAPAARQRQNNGNSAHGNSGRPSGGNAGRPSMGNAGRPSGNSGGNRMGGSPNVGRPNSNASGRPNVSNNSGRPGMSASGRPNGNNMGIPRSGNPGGSTGRSSMSGSGGRNAGPAGSNAGVGPRGRDGYGAGNNAGRNGHGPEKGNTMVGARSDGRGERGYGRGPDRGREGSIHHEPVRHVSDEHGRRVARDEHNRVREIHMRDSHGREMAIHRDLHGRARFETRRPDGRRVVGFGRGHGFTERRYYARGGRVYYQRTYVYGGRRYAVAYRYYPYHGVYYYGYAPVYYYHPVFYGWAYNPWAVPVVYRWGWYGDPWYGYYGPYFTPYPAYATASLWLTDYLLAENLRAAYEANAAAAQANANAAQANAAVAQDGAQAQGGGQVALSPEVKQMIADEVKRQLDAERAAAATQGQQSTGGSDSGNAASAEDVPAALDPNQRVFIVASNLDLAGDSGECMVSAGDVLMRMGTEPDQNNRIAVNVVSSKAGDCPANTNSDVEVTALQEMHNQFREKLDAGLKNLAENQGKNGLPKAPDTSTVGGEVPPPQADNDAATELQDQQKDAEQAEQDTQKTAPGGAGGEGGR